METDLRKSGIGLGLSIAHRIIENHYGNIEFKSKEGQGTTFNIAIPLERMEDKTSIPAIFEKPNEDIQ